MAKAKFTTYIGQRFVRWTVLSEILPGIKRPSVMCRCDCGTEKHVGIYNLKYSRSRCCGCINNENRRKYENSEITKSSEYGIWSGMLQRTGNPKSERYADYGGRGIKVCDRWKNFTTFYSDMGPRPSKKYSIERIDNDGDYEPGNCKWATAIEQGRNTRKTRILEVGGRSMNIAEWARDLGVDPAIISKRLARGWSDKDAVTVALIDNATAIDMARKKKRSKISR